MGFRLISTVTSPGGTGVIDFSNIPQSFTDLRLVLSGRNSASGAETYMTINGSGGNGSATNVRYLRGVGNNVSTYGLTGQGAIFQTNFQSSSDTANTFGSLEMYIPNYSNSTTNKIFSIESVHENNATSAFQILIAALVNLTAPVTSIQLITGTGNFVAGSSASIYGITRGSGGATVS